MNENQALGTLVGNTGQLTVTAALEDSYSLKRGGFVRIPHKEDADDDQRWVLGRAVAVRRQSMFFDESLGGDVSDIQLLTEDEFGEDVFASIELIGYVDRETSEIKTPRRPIDPGSKLYPVDAEFLQLFYEYTPQNSIQLGHLVGYEEGESAVPIYIDVNKIATEHMAVLAMTGAGKSYTVGRIMELMLTRTNASILVFDPHGEYGKAITGGGPQFNDLSQFSGDTREELEKTRQRINELQQQGGGLQVYAPEGNFADRKYGQGNYTPLKLRLDSLTKDELTNIMPSMTEPQERLLSVVLRYWESKYEAPRAITDLIDLLSTDFDNVRSWSQLTEEERSALNARSASIIALRLRNLVRDTGIFYDGGAQPIDIVDMVGRRDPLNDTDELGRIAIVDLQNISNQAMQVVVGIIGNELIDAISEATNPIRPVFTVLEEGHIFAPSQGSSVAEPIIRKIAAEGRKFGIGLGIISQRPSKLDSDVTSQCNTLVTMRLKNPEDQAFIRQASEMLSEQDIDELPALSTGEALVTGEAIRAPLLVKVGPKALEHGGMSPEVVQVWRGR